MNGTLWPPITYTFLDSISINTSEEIFLRVFFSKARKLAYRRSELPIVSLLRKLMVMKMNRNQPSNKEKAQGD